MIDEPFLDVIATVVSALNRAGIAYGITGSIASGIYGEPVVSQDVDIAVRMTSQQARDLSTLLPERFYRSDERIIAVANESGMTNLIDTETALKVDLCVLPKTSFYDAVMMRCKPQSFGPEGSQYNAVSAEDIVLMKLFWRADSRSEKQWRNALSVVQVQRNRLDWKYMFGQARAIGVERDLAKLRDEAGV